VPPAADPSSVGLSAGVEAPVVESTASLSPSLPQAASVESARSAAVAGSSRFSMGRIVLSAGWRTACPYDDRVKRDGFIHAGNATALVTAAILALMLLCVPLALRLDERIDRDRPMYSDLSRMTAMQDTSLAETGKAVPTQLSGGESAEIGSEEFVASDGVSVVVRGLDGDTAYCITVRNEHGSESDEHCS
jgi:hypothetical protein